MGWIVLLIGAVIVAVAIHRLMFPGRRGEADFQDRIGRVQEKHSPEQTRFEARKETKAAVARTEEAIQLGAESRAVKDMTVQQAELEEAEIHRAHIPQRMRRQQEAEEAVHVTTVLDLQLRQHLTKLAMQEGVSVDVLMSFIQKEKLDDLELKKLAQEAKIKIEAGLIYQLRSFQQVLLIGRSIDMLLEDIDQIERDSKKSDTLKQRMIAEREDDIEFLREKRHVERQRLLQADNGQNNQGSDEDSDD